MVTFGAYTTNQYSIPLHQPTFSGSKKTDKKIGEARAFLATEYLQKYQELLDTDSLEKQLRINTYVEISPEDYLNGLLAEIHTVLEQAEQHLKTRENHAEQFGNTDFTEDDNYLTDEQKAKISKNVKSFENNRENGLRELITLLKEKIDDLEQLKSKRFGITEAYTRDTRLIRKILKSLKKPPEVNRTLYQHAYLNEIKRSIQAIVGQKNITAEVIQRSEITSREALDYRVPEEHFEAIGKVIEDDIKGIMPYLKHPEEGLRIIVH